MFSIVLKNSILMILFIMIVHFMIINYLCDLQRVYKKKEHILNTIHTSINPSNVVMDMVDTPELPPIDNSEAKIEQHETLQDLYDFVYNDTSQETEDITQLFTGDVHNPLPSHLTVPCEDQPVDTDILFCKNKVDDLYEKNKKEILADGVPDASTLHGNPIVYEYKNDVDDSLQGFEGFSSAFMPY
jgi:hypothetical protein